jgi:predicted GIY-YIG superfamily endonuclease
MLITLDAQRGKVMTDYTWYFISITKLINDLCNEYEITEFTINGVKWSKFGNDKIELVINFFPDQERFYYSLDPLRVDTSDEYQIVASCISSIIKQIYRSKDKYIKVDIKWLLLDICPMCRGIWSFGGLCSNCSSNIKQQVEEQVNKRLSNIYNARNQKSSDNSCYVYLIKEIHTNNTKIGISVNPEARIKQLNSSSHLEIIFKRKFSSRDEAFVAERKAHKVLKEHKIRNEWFNLDITLREEIQKLIVSI